MKNFARTIGLLLSTLTLAGQAHAITELSASVGYDKKVYGSERQNNQVRKHLNSSVALYLFSNTAIELNFMTARETTTEKTSLRIQGTDIDLTGLENKVDTNVYGIGIRQALAGRNAIVRPFLSLGYAKQFVSDITEYTFQGPLGVATLNGGRNKRRIDSVFGTFTLQLRLTQTLAINASVRTLFPAFEFSEARDDLRYSAGFTWIF
jgi:hypothetical protein